MPKENIEKLTTAAGAPVPDNKRTMTDPAYGSGVAKALQQLAQYGATTTTPNTLI